MLPCQAPGVIGSVLGLVGPVSVYCDWVRWKVGSATSISVWQHVNLSEQIRPWDTLACCWDVKQPTISLTKSRLTAGFPLIPVAWPLRQERGLPLTPDPGGGHCSSFRRYSKETVNKKKKKNNNNNKSRSSSSSRRRRRRQRRRRTTTTNNNEEKIAKKRNKKRFPSFLQWLSFDCWRRPWRFQWIRTLNENK